MYLGQFEAHPGLEKYCPNYYSSSLADDVSQELG